MKAKLWGIGFLALIAVLAILSMIASYNYVAVAHPNGEIHHAVCDVAKQGSDCTSENLTRHSLTKDELANKSGRYKERLSEFEKAYDYHVDSVTKYKLDLPFIANSEGTIIPKEELLASYYTKNTGDILFNEYGLPYYNFISNMSGSNGVLPMLIQDGNTVAYTDGTNIVSTQPISEAPDFIQEYLADESNAISEPQPEGTAKKG